MCYFSNQPRFCDTTIIDLADCLPVVIVLAHSHFCPPRPVCLLSALDGPRPRGLETAHLALRLITSLLADRLPHWYRALPGHTDKVFAHYVLEGLREGFRIAFTPAGTLSPAPSNMQSARLHPTVISDYISKEVEEGRMFGPFLPGQIPV